MTDNTKLILAEKVEAWRRKRLLERTRTVELPQRTVPSDNYVYEAGGRKTETINSKLRRLLETDR